MTTSNEINEIIKKLDSGELSIVGESIEGISAFKPSPKNQNQNQNQNQKDSDNG